MKNENCFCTLHDPDGLMLGACGTDPTTVVTMESPIQIFSLKWIPMRAWYQSLAQLFKENKLTADTLPDDVKDQLTSSYGVTEAQIEAAAKWQDTLESLVNEKDRRRYF